MRDYINKVFEKYCFPEAKDFVEKDLESGKCMLLLDGFDELATRENQVRVAEEIHRFMEQYHHCRVLVTSRIAGYHDELSGFTRLELIEFDDNQVKQFIDNWFGKDEPKKAQSMLKAVKENQNIKNMAKNPLMLAIIAVIYEEDRELPQRRADLYKRSMDVLLSKWDLRKKLKNRFSVDKKEFILRKLAFLCHCRNQRTITEKEVLKEISRHSSRLGLKKEETKPILEEIWQRSYILRQISMDTYDFLHLSFQEYFTALELKEQEDGIGTIIKHISEPWWEEPILLYAGVSRDAEPLIKRMQTEVPEDIFYSNLMLSGKCIADAEFTNPDLKEEITQKLWQLYNNAELELIKNRAKEVLRRLQPQSIIDLLLNQLKDNDPWVRKRAVEDLGVIGSVEALPLLFQALSRDKDTVVRRRAAEALGAIGSVEALPSLVQALSSNKDFFVRWRAAEALAAIGSVEALPALFKALSSDKDNIVRRCAAYALGTIGNEEALAWLIQLLSSEKEPYVRGLAEEALGTIGSEEALPLLFQALNCDKDSSVRVSAASALGAIGSEKALPFLFHALSCDKNTMVRRRAAEALGNIGSEQSLPFLFQTLSSDKDSSVRGRTAYALGTIGNAEALPLLFQALSSDKDSEVRRFAAFALGAIGSDEALPALVQALTSDNSSYVRGRAAYALGAIGSMEALPLLFQALINDKDSYVRGSAAEALEKIGDDTAIIPLKKALEDEGEFRLKKVKDKAFEALEKISRRTGKRILSRK